MVLFLAPPAEAVSTVADNRTDFLGIFDDKGGFHDTISCPDAGAWCEGMWPLLILLGDALTLPAISNGILWVYEKYTGILEEDRLWL